VDATTAPADGLVLTHAAQAEQLRLPDGSMMRLLADSPATAGKLSVHTSTLRNGGGAGPHHHLVASEVFYVVRGAVELLIGEAIVTAGEGDLAVVPPGVPHAFAAVAGSDAELLIAVTPGIERFDLFRTFERVLSGREPAGTLFDDQSAYDTYPDHSPTWERARATAAHSPASDRNEP
jgi:quercetin dioxygenase-like cupin family protein